MAVLVASLTVVMCAGCSPSERPSAAEASLVRATTSPPETVGVETADLYRAREVPGVVERRPERTVRSTWTGTFTQARGIRRGGTVPQGARVGTVRTCAAPSGAAASTEGGDATSATQSGPTQSGPTQFGPTQSGVTTTGRAATTPCHPRWHVVRAPVGGTITALAGAEVTGGGEIVRIRPPGFVIRATVTDPAALYDLMRPPRTGKTRVLGGPAGFTVRFERRTYDATDGFVVLLLAVPDEITVVEGLRTSTAFVVSRRTKVPTLPVTAVQGTTGKGRVVVVDGDRTVVTAVELGQHDGSRVEVTGLPPATRVLRFPLASDFLVAP